MFLVVWSTCTSTGRRRLGLIHSCGQLLDREGGFGRRGGRLVSMFVVVLVLVLVVQGVDLVILILVFGKGQFTDAESVHGSVRSGVTRSNGGRRHGGFGWWYGRGGFRGGGWTHHRQSSW